MASVDPAVLFQPGITLGALARGVSSFQASVDSSGRIILEPFAEIPAREKWLFENKDTLGTVRD